MVLTEEIVAHDDFTTFKSELECPFVASSSPATVAPVSAVADPQRARYSLLSHNPSPQEPSETKLVPFSEEMRNLHSLFSY